MHVRTLPNFLDHPPPSVVEKEMVEVPIRVKMGEFTARPRYHKPKHKTHHAFNHPRYRLSRPRRLSAGKARQKGRRALD